MALIVVAMLVWSGCHALGLPCINADDCAIGELCVASTGQCARACNVDEDCGPGDACRAGLCIADEGAEGESSEGEGASGDEGEGEGAVVAEGEGEGVVVAEGEGEGEGEGVVAEGEGEGTVVAEGEGEGVVVAEGEGEGAVAPENPGPPDPCAATDPFRADLNGDCEPDLVVGAPAIARVAFMEGKADGVGTNGTAGFEPVLGDLGALVVGSAGAGSAFGAAIALEPDRGARAFRRVLVGIPGAGVVRALQFESTGAALFSETTLGAQQIDPGTAGFGSVLATTRIEGGDTFRVLVADSTGGGRLQLGGEVTGPFAGALSLSIGVPIKAAVRIPDKDGDGKEDFLVGAPGFVRGPQTLGAFAVSSADLHIIDSYTFSMPDGSTSFGTSLANLGDLDGDQRTDIAFGGPDDGAAGRVYLQLSKRARGTLVVVSAPGADAGPQSRFGFAVSPIGDLDGDGRVDIAIGAPLFRKSAVDDAACDAVAPAGYTGDCAGAVYFLGSTTLSTTVGTNASAFRCITASARDRLGFALRPLGPHPDNATLGQRIAIGSPGTPGTDVNGNGVEETGEGSQGSVLMLTVVANVTTGTCTSPFPLGGQGGSVVLITSNSGTFGIGDSFGSSFAN